MGKREYWALQWLNSVKEKPERPWKVDWARDPEALQIRRSEEPWLWSTAACFGAWRTLAQGFDPQEEGWPSHSHSHSTLAWVPPPSTPSPLALEKGKMLEWRPSSKGHPNQHWWSSGSARSLITPTLSSELLPPLVFRECQVCLFMLCCQLYSSALSGFP